MSHPKRDAAYDRENFVRISPDVELGEGVRIISFVNLYGCRIGDDTQLGAFVEIQRGAVIGARCKISSHTFICEGVTIEDGCFIGHGVLFINDRRPRAVNPDGTLQGRDDWSCEPTRVASRAQHRLGRGDPGRADDRRRGPRRGGRRGDPRRAARRDCGGRAGPAARA